MGEVADIYDGTHQTPTYVKSGVRFVSVENINSLANTEKFITKEAYEKEYKVKPKKGDLLMTRITAGIIGATAIIQDNEPLAYYVSLALIRVRKGYKVNFLQYRIESSQFKKELNKRIIHVAFPKKINLGDIHACTIAFPTIAEQEKIASFFSLLDERIQTQNKIIGNLETLINNFRRRLFNKKLSFRLESHKTEWKEYTISEILKIGSGKDYKHLNTGKIPVFGTGGLMTFVDKYLYNGETVCIGRKGTIDKPMYHNGKIWTVDTLFYTHSFKNCIPKFVFHLFKTIKWLEYKEASGVPSLSKSTIEKIRIRVPTIKEQEIIVSFLGEIDNKIQLEKSILEKFIQNKNYLLKQMFV
ncbi:restriction endonuclease subunit S [Chryseobacterium sp. R2ACT005]|uniref:restriction endonuclease subunit S n=1 Tax=Chryseobacterium sp. R2ACT005 TaxID=3416668 RepID=UPI003CEB9E90